MRSYLDTMLRYFEISGRSTRAQYWLFFLFYYILLFVALAVDWHTGGLDPRHPKPTALFFVMLVHVVPSTTVLIRRLHDIGRSGFWMFINAVPIVGPFILLYWTCCASDSNRNDYDDIAPSSYQPRYTRPGLPAGSTIPRQVRMGNGLNTRSPSGVTGGTSERFI